MKAEIALSLGIGLLAIAGVVHAEVPKGTYPASQLKEACEEAAKARKGVALLLADSGVKQEKHVDAMKGAVRSLKGHSIVVFVESKSDDMKQLPPPAYTALRDIKLGTFIPMATITSPDLLEVWTMGTGIALAGENPRKTLTRMKTEAAEKAADWDPEATTINPRDQIWKWSGSEKGHFEGKFDGLGEEKMNVIDKNGRKGSIELAKLSEASIAYAKELAGTEPSAEPGAGFEMEPWTSSDGKTIQAKFVGLKDGKVSLELEGGKKVNFPLSRLDADSAAKAEAHAFTQ